MMDSLDSMVDRNESPSEPFPGYTPQTVPMKTAAPSNGKHMVICSLLVIHLIPFNESIEKNKILHFTFFLYFRPKITWISYEKDGTEHSRRGGIGNR